MSRSRRTLDERDEEDSAGAEHARHEHAPPSRRSASPHNGLTVPADDDPGHEEFRYPGQT